MGRFTTNYTTVYHLVRLNLDGSDDATFSPYVLGYNSSWIAGLQPDGGILVQIVAPIGNLPSNLIRFRPDGTLDRSFQPALPFIQGALAIEPDGGFTAFARPTPNPMEFTDYRPKRFTATGALDPSFNAVITSSSGDGGVLQQSDGKVIVWAQDSMTYRDADNHFKASTVFRLNRDGSMDPTFDPSAEPGSMFLQADGGVLVVGKASDPTGIDRKSTRLNSSH